MIKDLHLYTSSGIRKNFGDITNELGEDAFGFQIYNNHCILWIVDGTSQESSLDNEIVNISSRTLAKEIGNAFSKVIISNFSKIIPITFNVKDIIVENLKSNLKKSWTEKIKKLSLKDIKTLPNIDGDKNTFLLLNSTTFIGSVIDLKFMQGFMIGVGDSLAVIKNNGRVIIFPEELGGRFTIAAKISFIEDKKFKLDINIALHEHGMNFSLFEDVRGICVMTDGVIRKEIVEKVVKEPKYYNILTERLKDYYFKSNDDKTLFIMEI